MDTERAESYDHIESTIQPEEAQPEAAPEQPLEKPKKKGRPAGTKDTYKRTRKSSTTKASAPPSVPPSAPPYVPASQDNAVVDRYEQPMGLDMNTLADLMIQRRTVRASDARALRTQRWEKFMPHR